MTADVPIRYSIQQLDFDPALGERLIAYLDGVEQKNAVAYDLEAETVTIVLCDAMGHPLVDRAKQEYMFRVLTGVVEVKLRPAVKF